MVASRKTDATKAHKPSHNFVEGMFDALTSYNMPFFADPLSPHTLHLAFSAEQLVKPGESYSS